MMDPLDAHPRRHDATIAGGRRSHARHRLHWHARLDLRDRWIVLFESSCDASVNLLSIAPQKAFVSDVLYERVFERVSNVRRYATPEYELGVQ